MSAATEHEDYFVRKLREDWRVAAPVNKTVVASDKLQELIKQLTVVTTMLATVAAATENPDFSKWLQAEVAIITRQNSKLLESISVV